MTKLAEILAVIWRLHNKKTGAIQGIIILSVATLLFGCGKDVDVNPDRGKEPKEQALKSTNNSQGDVNYNPENCKTDAEGMVYFAAGREVFRVPYEYKLSILGMDEKQLEELPVRPDPSEPEGCPDNPIAGKAFSIPYHHQPKNPEKYPPDTSFMVENLRIIARKRDVPEKYKGTSVEYGTQISNEEMFSKVRKKYNSCESFDNGLVGCRVPKEDENVPKEKWSIKFRAKQEVYVAPFDRPFVVACVSYAVLGFQECDISYNYPHALRIAYRFKLQDLPVLEIIEFDKGVRKQVEAMRVSNYKWPSD